MKTFKLYKHPIKGYESVKVGFSWPATIITVPWMLAKRLWGYAILWIFLFVAANSLDRLVTHAAVQPGLSESAYDALLAVLFVISATYLVLTLIPGFKGNFWRVKNLEKRGYEFVQETKAKSADAALNGVVTDTAAPQSA